MDAEIIKQKFVEALTVTTKEYGRDWVLEKVGGPKQIVDVLLRNQPTAINQFDIDKIVWLQNNREEAEQLIAGVLGLM